MRSFFPATLASDGHVSSFAFVSVLGRTDTVDKLG